MPIKVTIPNYGTVLVEGAAEESTMRQILTALNKGAGTTSGSKSGTGGVPPGGGDTAGDKATADAKKKGEAAEKGFTDSLNVFGDALEGTAQTFGKSFSNTTPAIKDFTGYLASMPLANLKGVSGVITQFGGVLDDQVQIFRHLSQSGIDLGDSLLTAQLKAGEARLPLEIFARTIKENSTSLSMAFGSASQGADKFASIQGKFMASSGQKFAALGFSMDELATYNASYMEQLNRSGKLRSMSDAEVAAGAEKYNQELDKMAKATGISRQQLDEANKATQRDARMKLALSKLDTDQQTAVNAKIAQLNQMDPSGQLAAGFKDLIAGGGVALTKEARNFTMTMQAAGVDAGKMTRDISKGQAGAIEQMNAGFYKAGKAGEQLSEGQRTLAMATATMGQQIPSLGLAQMAGMQDTNAAIDKARKEQAEKEAAAAKDPTRAVAGLDQTLTQIQNSFKKSFIETGTLDLTAKGMKMAADAGMAAADKFAEIDPSRRMITLFGAETAKVLVNDLVKLGGAAAATYLGAKGAGMAYDKYKDMKDGKPPAAEPAKTDTKKPGGTPEKPGSTTGKVLKEGAEELGEKPSWWQKAMGAFKRNRYVLLGTTVAGAAVYFSDELIDMATPDFLKARKTFETGGSNTSGVTTNNATAGANIPQNMQPGVNNQTVTGQMSKEVADLNAALKSTDFSKLAIPESVGASIDQSVIKLKNLKDTISTTTSAFKDLNTVNLTTLNESINKLNTTVEKQSTQPKAEKVSAVVPPGAEKEMVALLNQLNMNMGQMVSQQSDAVDYLSKTAKYTRQATGNMV
jgi:hypothetical protein